MAENNDDGDEAALNQKLFHADGRPKRQPTGDYDIGNCRPPDSGKFKPKGQSGGNRKGRQKGSRDLRTELAAELNRKVTFEEDGKIRRVSMRRFAIMQLSMKAYDGDVLAIKEFLNRDQALLLDKGPERVRELSPNDRGLLDAIINGNFDQLPDDSSGPEADVRPDTPTSEEATEADGDDQS
jgi:Family of unknown function (DUF5681)